MIHALFGKHFMYSSRLGPIVARRLLNLLLGEVDDIKIWPSVKGIMMKNLPSTVAKPGSDLECAGRIFSSDKTKPDGLTLRGDAEMACTMGWKLIWIYLLPLA